MVDATTAPIIDYLDLKDFLFWGQEKSNQASMARLDGEDLSKFLGAVAFGLLPYNTVAARDADTSQAEGAIAYVWNDTVNGFSIWDGAAWQPESFVSDVLLTAIEDLVAEAELAKVGAEEARDAIVEALNKLSIYINPPTAGSALSRLIEVNLFLEVNGVKLNWPDDIGVREIAADSSNRFRFRIGGGDTLDGEGAYPEIASEQFFPTALNIPYDTLSAGDILPLYSVGTALGVDQGTVVGTYKVDFDGTTFGTYFPFVAFPHSEGGLRRELMLPTDLQVSNTEAIVRGVLSQEPSNRPWVSTVTDQYARAVVKDVSIERGVPGRTYVLRYRNDTAGSTRRFQFYLYDPVIGASVASWTQQKEYNFASELPEAIHLTGVANGSPQAGWTGVSATVWLNKDEVKFDNRVTVSVIDPEVLGIKADRVLSRERVREMIRSGEGILNHRIVVAASGGDFTTVKAAMESVLNELPKPRAWYPYSDYVSPSNQYEIVVLDRDHIEEWPGGIVDQGDGSTFYGQGMILFEGLTLRLNHGTILYTTGDATYAWPLFEANYGGRIIGPLSARLEQRGDGYIVHQDPGNTLSKPASVGPAEQVFQMVFLSDGIEYFSAEGNEDWMIGCGFSDDQDSEFRNGRMIRGGATSTEPCYGTHTSPNSLIPGRVTFTNMSFNDDEVVGRDAIRMITSPGHAAQASRHELRVNGSKIANINASAQYVASGDLSGASVTPAGILD